MRKPPDPQHRYRFPADLISHAVWLYHVFSLSFRDVELLLAERGVIVSYESVRQWCVKFGASFADKLRRRRPQPGDKWHLATFLHRCGESTYRRVTARRPLGIPTVADRSAQEVVKRYLEPILERIFHKDSYGYRPGRSAIDVVRTARQRCWRL
jgi:putative transposase